MGLLKGLIIGILISMPLGPIAIMIIQRTVNKSLKSGIVSALGATTGDVIYAIIAGFSLSYIISFIREYQTFFQFFGASVLFILGIYVFRKNPTKSLRKFRRQGTKYYQDFFSTLLIVLSNLLIVLFYIAIFAGVGITFSFNHFAETCQIILGFALGCIAWWFLLTSIINMMRHKLNLHILWWFNKISGVIIMVFAVSTAVLFLIKGNPTI